MDTGPLPELGPSRTLQHGYAAGAGVGIAVRDSPAVP